MMNRILFFVSLFQLILKSTTAFTFPSSSSCCSSSSSSSSSTRKNPSSGSTITTPRSANQHFSTASTSGLFNYDVNEQLKRNDIAARSTTATGAATTSTLIDASTAPGTATTTTTTTTMNPIKAKVIKAGIVSFIASMCIALPTTLLPVKLLHKAKLITTLQKEQVSFRTGCFCSRWLMRLIPFANCRVVSSINTDGSNPEPTIWVCNHTSMLDLFFLLAKDKKLRGNNRRPIKIIYWKDLEKNPVTKLMFTMSGFISVEMEDNGNGNANTYKKSSFKALLKSIKKAFDDGFDIGILPEGQLNPTPEQGLQPVFGGAFTLSKMSKRPIKMMGIHGLHNLWHGDEKIGMAVSGRNVTMRNYNLGGNFANSNEFVDAFKNVVGHFGATGTDLPDWKEWTMGLIKKEEEESVTL